MIVKLLTEHQLESLSLKGCCRGSSESTHIKMPYCWKSHALAQIIIVFGDVVGRISRWLLWQPSWISELNYFSKSEPLCHTMPKFRWLLRWHRYMYILRADHPFDLGVKGQGHIY